MHFAPTDVYILNSEVHFVGCLSVTENCRLCNYYSLQFNAEIQNAWSYTSTSKLINDVVVN